MLVSFKSNYNIQNPISQHQQDAVKNGGQNITYNNTNTVLQNTKVSNTTNIANSAAQPSNPFAEWSQPDFKNTKVVLEPKKEQYSSNAAPSKVIKAPCTPLQNNTAKNNKLNTKTIILGLVTAAGTMTASIIFLIKKGGQKTGVSAGYLEKLREGFNSLFRKRGNININTKKNITEPGTQNAQRDNIKNVLPREEDYKNKQKCKTRARAKNDSPKEKYVCTQLFSPKEAKKNIDRIINTNPDNSKFWEKDFLKSYNYTETIFDKLDNKEEISKALWNLRIKIAQWGCHSKSEAESFARNMPLAIERFGIEGLQRLSEDFGPLNYKVSSLMFLDKPCNGINDYSLYYMAGTFPHDAQRVLLKMSASELRDMSEGITTKLGNPGGALNLNKEDIGLDYLINKADKEFFNKLKPETSKALSGFKPYFAVNADIGKKESLLEKLQFIEEDFTPEELKTISKGDEYTLKTLFAYINNDFNYDSKTGCYLNLPDELHSIAKNIDAELYRLRKKESFLRSIEPSKLNNYDTELLHKIDTVNAHFKNASPDVYDALYNFRLYLADKLLEDGSVDFSKYTKEVFERLEKRYTATTIEDIAKTIKGNKMLYEMLYR